MAPVTKRIDPALLVCSKMDLTKIKYSDSDFLPDWRDYFYRLGAKLADKRFSNSLIFIYLPYGKGIAPLITIGFFYKKIRTEFERKVEEHERFLKKKLKESRDGIHASYIFRNKRQEGTLKYTRDGFKLFRKDGYDIGCKGKNILKIHLGSPDDVQFRDFNEDTKQFVESFYNLNHMEYLNSIDPLKLEIWGTQKEIREDFEEEISTSDDISGRYIDLMGVTGVQGGNHVDEYIVSDTSLKRSNDNYKQDIILFDSGRAYMKGESLTNAELKIVLVDANDGHKRDAVNKYATDRMTSSSDINLEVLSKLPIPNGVEITGFK